MDVDRTLEQSLSWDIVHRDCPPIEQTDQEVVERFKETTALRERLFAYLDSHKDDAIKLLQNLINIPSVNPSDEFESRVADFLATRMTDLGMMVGQIEPALKRKSNVGVLNMGIGNKTLLFQSHIDTVPAGDPDKWKFDPFSGAIEDGKIYGRGAKDPKAGLAAAQMVIEAIVNLGIPLNGNIAHVTSCDEERGGHLGLHKVIENGYLPRADWAVYTEGLGADTMTCGSRGWCQFEVGFHGKSAHTAFKREGINAIVYASKVIPALDNMKFEHWEEHHFIPGEPEASVNIIKGGHKENVVPDSCTVTIDLRFPPGLTPENVVSKTEMIMRDMEVDPEIYKILSPEISMLSVARPSFVHPNETISRYVSGIAELILGQRPHPIASPGTSDMRWIAMDAKIPIVGYTADPPGNRTGHSHNEYFDLEGYFNTMRVYGALVLALLG